MGEELVAKAYHNWIIWNNEQSRQTLTKDLIELLGKYNLREKIIAYVKDEGSNLKVMTTTLRSIVNCNILGL